MSIFRVYVEKKPELSSSASTLKQEIKEVLGIDIGSLRLFIRYDAGNISLADFERAVPSVFSEAAADNVFIEELPKDTAGEIFAVSYLPGQYDQRADSAEQCVQLLTQGPKPIIKTAVVYVVGGADKKQIERIKDYLVNPVESEIVPLKKPDSLQMAQGAVAKEIIHNEFLPLNESGLAEFHQSFGFAMTTADLQFVQDYYKSIFRAPTHTELKVIDTYWSDHCRHTTFLTRLDEISFSGTNQAVKKSYQTYLELFDELYAARDDKYISLMDMATIGAKKLKIDGYIPDLDESEEINACSVRVTAEIDGQRQDWLVMFKNETHNHPTEIEPFGGAATCLGGAIRDPLSGRAYVYQAMRVTGCADPFTSADNTPRGKLLQRVITKTAARGFASYGNQIGLATGIVSEIYHNSYIAKRMEAGFVVAAAPAQNVVRERPEPGDKIILLGGDTGRDGCGGATGSSKAHSEDSVSECGAEVQKGNPIIERKIQRLMRNPKATTLIKRCNDFGAGGVCVAIGELADSLEIDLNAVPLKYSGLSGTEIAISESQERMAMVVAPQNADKFISLAAEENLNAVIVATVTDSGKLIMRHNGQNIVELDRAFLNTNGAEQHATAAVNEDLCDYRQTLFTETDRHIKAGAYKPAVLGELARLPVCSTKGLTEMFDSTIGSGTVYLPLGGKNQLTPAIAMAAKLPAEGETDDCTVASHAFYPYFSQKSPYSAAHYAVIGSVAKLIASGARREKIRLSFQEYFPRLGGSPERWGMPVAALLGALSAQLGLRTPSIGGKDSMSGSFENLDVVPTLISFAIAHHKASGLITNLLSAAGRQLYRLPLREDEGMPDYGYICAVYDTVSSQIAAGNIDYATVAEEGGAVCAVIKGCLGGGFGFDFSGGSELFAPSFGEIIFAANDITAFKGFDCEPVGITSERGFTIGGQTISQDEVLAAYTGTLEPIFPVDAADTSESALKSGSVAIGTSESAPKANSIAIDTNAANINDGEFSAPKETGSLSQSPATDNKSLQTAADFSGNISVNISKGARPKVLLPVFPGTNCEYDTYRKFLDAGGEPEVFIIKNRTASEVVQSAEELTKLIKQSNILALSGGFSGGDEPNGSGKFIATMLKNPKVRDSVLDLIKNRDGLILGICNGFQALIKLSLVPYGDIFDQTKTSPTLTHNTLPRHISRICKIKVNSAMSPWLSAVSPGDVYDVAISHGEGRFVCSDEQFNDFNSRGMIATQYCDGDGKLSMSGNVNANGSAYCVEGITSPCGRVFGKMGHSERMGDNLYKNYPGNFDMKIFESGIKYFK